MSPGDYPDPRPLKGDLLTRAAVAAYNTGEGNVLMSVAAGVEPDATSTGGDYGESVLASALDYVTRFAV